MRTSATFSIFMILLNISLSFMTGVMTVFDLREKIRKNVVFDEENNNFFLFLIELHLKHNSIKRIENPDNLKNQSSGHLINLNLLYF